ncbi:MAG: hypothetical protein ACF788_06645 [Novipirellula sp. JB048]
MTRFLNCLSCGRNVGLSFWSPSQSIMF